MELEEWIRSDMDRYISLYEPKSTREKYQVRLEDNAQIEQIDYYKLITHSLSQDRFDEAQTLSNKLKQRFLQIPVEHQQERKHFYDLVKKCYKEIHDYAEEKKHASKVLAQFNYDSNVFDSKVESHNLNAERVVIHGGDTHIETKTINMVSGPASKNTGGAAKNR